MNLTWFMPYADKTKKAYDYTVSYFATGAPTKLTVTDATDEAVVLPETAS